MTDQEFDAYGVLQITPSAEEFVLEASYRALARHFHPDGKTPDPARMADINRAYELVRTAERRKRYDRLHQIRPMGPGAAAASPSTATQAFGGRVPPPSAEPGGMGAPPDSASTIDFGRYEGWTLKDLVKHDPEYLRWLSRHSSGVRFRNQIMALLPQGEAAARR